MIDDCNSCINHTGYRDEYPCNECSVGAELDNHFEHIETYCLQPSCARYGLKMTDGYCRARCDDCKLTNHCTDATKSYNTYQAQCDKWIKAE